MVSQTVLSIVIPAYNRVAPLCLTLASVQSVRARLNCEVLLVDDGSTPPLRSLLPSDLLRGVHIIEQPNAGSIQARLHGLLQSSGDYVKFLDSDDLLDAEGVHAQLKNVLEDPVDVLYGDIGRRPGCPAPAAAARNLGIVEFALDAQPAPHAPIYRRQALLELGLQHSRLPSDRLYCATGDFWLYCNLLHSKLRARYLPGVVGYAGEHADGRYSDRWEQLGLVGGSMLWCMAQLSSHDPALCTSIARTALRSLIMLPLGTPRALQQLNHACWQFLDPTARLLAERPAYRRISQLLGFDAALWLARWRRPRHYRHIRTLSTTEIHELQKQLHTSLLSHGFTSPWSGL